MNELKQMINNADREELARIVEAIAEVIASRYEEQPQPLPRTNSQQS